MRFFLVRFFICVILVSAVNSVLAQVDTVPVTSIDPELLEWENPRTQKEYVIANVAVSGATHLDTMLIASISGLQKGQRFYYPGTDIFSRAINNLWKQNLFANVQIFVTRVRGENVDIEIDITERPRLADFKFEGVRKTESEELIKKMNLQKQSIISENMRRNVVEVVSKFYAEKGFANISVDLDEQKNPRYPNSNTLYIKVNKGKKVKIDGINFFGNVGIRDGKLKKQMKGTKEMTKMTLYPSKYVSTYGDKHQYTFKDYIKDYGFLSGTKTLDVLDPNFRFKFFSSSKFNTKKYEEDKEKVLKYFNSKGYRDARILRDTQVIQNNKMYVDIEVKQGHKYYFGDITWKGNSKYSDSLLSAILNIKKGDIYDASVLNKRLGTEPSQEGGDISTAYNDEGYLFFQIVPVETKIYNDTIDHEIRIIEGPQARIKNVVIMGNDRTKDHVIRREMRVLPGELYSKSDLMRSIRQLMNLNYFEQESINPQPVPNQSEGTVDINWKLKEKSSDQLELSAGWGGGIGLTGTLGVSFNNFSIKNIWKRSAWDPLPMGDGQKLSLRVQSNGRMYRSYNVSFTEPWLGGKKQNSLTFSYNNTKYNSSLYDYQNNRYRYEKDKSLLVNSFAVGFGKQLKWPDDYFSVGATIALTRYRVQNMGLNYGLPFNSGVSNNLSLKLSIQRSSVFDPIFPRSGSDVMASVQFTPPYSLLKGDSKVIDQYKNVEYHKWRFNSTWYIPIGRARGEDKNKQFVVKLAAKYGFMGRYNRDLDFSPFERFQLGDAGMSNTYSLTGFDIVAHRGYPVYTSSDPKVNPENTSSAITNLFTIFNKYQAELRYPVIINQSSTIYGLAFFEAANGWHDFKDYNPFQLRRSAGLGMRFYLPMFGLLGFDYGVGLDRIQKGQGIKGAGKFTFMLGFEPE
ncbi:MAG: POTRA domain-containing protein [Niabella sp.]